MENFSEKLLKPILYRPKSEEKKIEEGGSGRVKLGWRRLFIPRNIWKDILVGPCPPHYLKLSDAPDDYSLLTTCLHPDTVCWIIFGSILLLFCLIKNIKLPCYQQLKLIALLVKSWLQFTDMSSSSHFLLAYFWTYSYLYCFVLWSSF